MNVVLAGDPVVLPSSVQPVISFGDVIVYHSGAVNVDLGNAILSAVMEHHQRVHGCADALRCDDTSISMRP